MLSMSFGSLKDEVIVRVAAGGRHCLALTENGTVYSWGAAASSALGEASKQDRWVDHLFPLRCSYVADWL